MGKNNSMIAVAIILLLSVSLIVGVLVWKTHGQESELSFNWYIRYADGSTSPLSIFYEGKEINSIYVNVLMDLQVTGTVESINFEGDIITKYDGNQRKINTMSFPQSPNSDGFYVLGSESVIESELNQWSSAVGSHLLTFETTENATLTVHFSDGDTQFKTFASASASVTLNRNTDNSIDVADIIIDAGTEGSSQTLTTLGILYGWSGYPRTYSGTYTTNSIDTTISQMDANNLNVYRMSFNDFQSIDLVIQYTEYYLTHCNYRLILDYNHQYPMGALSSSMLTETTNEGLQLAEYFKDYVDRLILEPWNERDNSDMPNQAQTYINTLRNNGYSNRIVIDKWDTHTWTQMSQINDPLDEFYTGYHYYFTNGAWTTAESQMETALGRGLKLINTEIGADYNEAGQFQQSEVMRVNEFNSWCVSNGISNTVWMVYGDQNLATYINMGLRNPLTGNLIH